MSGRFLESAEQGRNGGWRYGLGVMVSLACGVAGYWVARAIAPSTYALSTIPFLFLIGGLWLSLRGLHHRTLRSLVTPTLGINWRRIFVGFGVWFGLAIAQTLLEFALNPQAFVWNAAPIQWLTFLPVALFLTPIQTTAEELLFRGYLLQGLGLLIRSPFWLTVVASLPFALVHFSNPEMERGAIWLALTYCALAVFLTAITLNSEGLELAIGVHAANNLFIVLFVNTSDSALPSPSLFMQTIPTDPRLSFGLLISAAIVFYWRLRIKN